MNASGRLNTCKSSENLFFGRADSGARVSNAYAIYLIEGNSPGKLGLMPHGTMIWHQIIVKDPSV